MCAGWIAQGIPFLEIDWNMPLDTDTCFMWSQGVGVYLG